jgi:hypothetical protein
MILVGWAENAINVAGRPSKAKMEIRVRIIFSKIFAFVCLCVVPIFMMEESSGGIGRKRRVHREVDILASHQYLH